MYLNIEICITDELFSKYSVNDRIVAGNLAKGAFKSILRRSSNLTKQVLSFSDFIFATDPGYLVFATQHGELQRTLKLLYSVAEQTELSPTQFAQSVHSTAPGLLTIANEKQVPFTTICAGDETFCMAMIEAIAHLRNNHQSEVCVIFADDKVPDDLIDGIDDTDQYSLAVKLRCDGPYTVEISKNEVKDVAERLQNKRNVRQMLESVSTLSEFNLISSSLNLKWKLSSNDIKTS
ncbi:beta-ketoacyl synthase chain length factor [Vibrio sp. MA40-2]|uniref:beta-ketoacyl synthase chain length factor n=1 Tax=Vibrio sp. MA40-2 TaxID=3391828 RepID=UPI0039A648E2